MGRSKQTAYKSVGGKSNSNTNAYNVWVADQPAGKYQSSYYPFSLAFV